MDYITDGVAAGAFSSDIDNQSAGNYQYDGNGNIASAIGDSLGCILYDINNQPTGAYTFKTNAASYTYKYDANGMRTQKQQGSATTSYILGATGNTEVVVTGSTALTYNFFAGAENIGQARRSGSTLTRYYYLKDHLGDIRATLTTAGAVDSYEDFYPYGQLMDGRSQTGSADPRYKYTGKERDAETSYDYFGARYYDGRIGRFLSVDPLAARFPSWSAYHYSYGNPLRFKDPTGKAGEETDDEKKREANKGLNQGPNGATGVKRIGRAIQMEASFGAEIGPTFAIGNKANPVAKMEATIGDAIVVGLNLALEGFAKTQAGGTLDVKIPSVPEISTGGQFGSIVDAGGPRNYKEANLTGTTEKTPKTEIGTTYEDSFALTIGAKAGFLGAQVSMDFGQIYKGLKEIIPAAVQIVNGIRLSGEVKGENVIPRENP